MWKIHFCNGNSKTGKGIVTFSTLAGCAEYTLKDGTHCKGTCSCCMGCNGKAVCEDICYAVRTYRRWRSVVEGHARNTRAVRDDVVSACKALSECLKRKKKAPVAVRYHAAGELESLAQLDGYASIAESNPAVPEYIYTKNYTVVDAFLAERDLPTNMTVLISIYGRVGMECYRRHAGRQGVKAFAIVNGRFTREWYHERGLDIDGFCPAYRPDVNGMVKGHKCEDCKLCFIRGLGVIGCWEH